MDPLILFIIIGSIAGFLLGAVVGLFIARRGSSREVEEEVVSAEQPQVDDSQPLAEPPAQLTNRTLEDYQPLICLWRGGESGNLAIEIKGKLYPTADSFDLKAREHLINLTQEWQHWLGMESEHDMAFAAQTADQEKMPAPVQTEEIKTAEIPPAAQKGAPPPEKEDADVTEVDELRSKTMVEQIDEILQEKLSASSLSNRSIRIMEGPEKGVVVWVGLTHYSGIDEVDDPEVMKMIRSAVAEWEARAGGKRR